MVLHAEHGFNASTFTGRVVGSTLANPYSTIAGAVGSLSGPLHGGANERVLHMLRTIPTAADAVPFLDKMITTKQKIMGLGHRVYKVKDPRATVLQGMAADLFKERGLPRSMILPTRSKWRLQDDWVVKAFIRMSTSTVV